MCESCSVKSKQWNWSEMSCAWLALSGRQISATNSFAGIKLLFVEWAIVMWLNV